MVYFARDPLGYKKLLTWQQADRIYQRTIEITKEFHPIKDSRLIDQMVSSARSGKRNIEEGFKRATTEEYIKFLGFSIASLAELRGDYEDCLLQGKITQEVAKEMEALLRGEDTMLGRQIQALERKMEQEYGVSSQERARRALRMASKEPDIMDQFLKEHGLIRDEKGIVRAI
jgi:four helix bundle protein